MKINDRLIETRLVDYYGVLLTEHQKSVLFDYYYNDYSMIEIAENNNVSKSAISDLIKRSIKQLYDYEGKLHLIENSHKRMMIIDELSNHTDSEVIALSKKLKDLE